MSLPSRKTASLNLRRDLLSAAKSLGVNVTAAAEAGIAQAVKDERARRWQAKNAEAIRAYNAHVTGGDQDEAQARAGDVARRA